MLESRDPFVWLWSPTLLRFTTTTSKTSPSLEYTVLSVLDNSEHSVCRGEASSMSVILFHVVGRIVAESGDVNTTSTGLTSVRRTSTDTAFFSLLYRSLPEHRWLKGSHGLVTLPSSFSSVSDQSDKQSFYPRPSPAASSSSPVGDAAIQSSLSKDIG